MASETFFNRVPYTHRRAPSHHLDDLLAAQQAASSGSGSAAQRSVRSTRSGGALTFPPLYLDPVDSHGADLANNPHPSNPSGPGSVVLGSTFYHHPELNALVSNHLTDAFANAADGATGTGNVFTNGIYSNRDADEESDSDDAAGTGGVGAAPRPKITSEFVSLNEDLVPASLDMQGDMLPADQHPSYPFGNLFGPLGGMIAADSAIVGGERGASAAAAASLGAGLGDSAATLGLDFGGGLEGFISLGQSSHGRRSAVSNAWNTFINKASKSKLVGSAGAHTDWNVDDKQTTTSFSAAQAVNGKKELTQADIVRSAKKLDLSPNLLFRTNTSTVLAPPTWPFRRHGPGNTSYAALLRPSSNIFGSSPASAAVAATLGGLPASAKIINEVWSDLALEELVPTSIFQTSALRHLDDESDQIDGEEGSASGNSSKKRKRTDAEADCNFAKRVAAMEADPLDLLGPVSREIRGQAARPWGTAMGSSSRRVDGRPSRRRHQFAYSNQSDDEAVEAEHDDPETGYVERDRVRYSFSLPPARFSWTESPDPDEEHESQDDDRSGTLHVELDGIGWSTAKRIFVNEERDRLLPEIASRATGPSGEIEAYQVRGIRANQGMLPRPAWTWADGPVADADAGDRSMMTEMSGSTSHQTDLHAAGNGHLEDSEAAHYEDEWRGVEGEDEDEDAELQRALLLQYQAGVADNEGHHDEEDDVEEDEYDAEEPNDQEQYVAESEDEGEDMVEEDDEEVGSFEEDEAS